MSKKGVFIAVEGSDGTGKTTFIANLEKELIEYGFSVLITKEPSCGKIGELIINNNWKKIVLAYLIAADRLDHLEKIIIPNIVKGVIVISDRYVGSSYVYQVLDAVPVDIVSMLNRNMLRPDVNFILRANEEIVIQRLKERKVLSYMEKKFTVSELLKAYDNAGKLLEKEYGNVVWFDNNTEEDMKKNLKNAICAINGLMVM